MRFESHTKFHAKKMFVKKQAKSELTELTNLTVDGNEKTGLEYCDNKIFQNLRGWSGG